MGAKPTGRTPPKKKKNTPKKKKPDSYMALSLRGGGVWEKMGRGEKQKTK